MEVLVAMVIGIVVTGALFAILEVSLHQTSRITDRVQATQLGRTAMTKMVDELHSACLAREFAPVRANSGPKELRFATGFSEKTLVEPSEAYEHRIVWNGTTQNRAISWTTRTTPKSAAAGLPSNSKKNPRAKNCVSENVYRQTNKAKEKVPDLPVLQVRDQSQPWYERNALTSTLTQIALRKKKRQPRKAPNRSLPCR